MIRVRAHVRLVATVWLTCQLVAFAAAPFVLCNDHGVMSDVGPGHECDPRHHHRGEPAQPSSSGEHHHHGSEPAAPTDAAIDCRCTVSDAALAALTSELGILANEFVLNTTLVTARVVSRDYAAPTRSDHIDTPPPRA